MLADTVELVIGVDTHKQTHTAAVVATATGHTTVTMTVPAPPAGYRQLLELAGQHHRQRVWAIEGTGGYGAGLTRFLHAHAEQVVELDRDQLAQPRTSGPTAALSVRLAARRSAVQAEYRRRSRRVHRPTGRIPFRAIRSTGLPEGLPPTRRSAPPREGHRCISPG
jgi:transposase